MAKKTANKIVSYDKMNLTKLEAMIIDLKKDGDQIFLKPEGESALLKVLEIQEFLDGAIKDIKEKLATKAEKVDPNFTSISGDNIKVYYRFFGSRYGVDSSLVEKVPEGLLKREIRYSVDIKALEEYIEIKKGVPYGIVVKDRQKSISFAKKKGLKNED